jgi:hypothetical protein
MLLVTISGVFVITKPEPIVALPSKLYRGLKFSIIDWPGERVSEDSLLIKVHEVKDSNKAPFIWCGYVENLSTIVSICGKDRSIYCIRGPVGLFRATENVIGKLGRYYAHEIEKAIPAGPYMIAGFCHASYLAIEIATLLIQRGHHVGFLGFVEADIPTGDSLLSKYARKVFNRINYHGTRIRSSLNSIESESPTFFTYIRKIPKILNDGFGKEPAEFHLDIDRDIYKFRKERDVMYQIKPYPSFLHLFYIRWSIYGFYQLDFFKKYWRATAKDGVKLDFIHGAAHQYADWPAIIERINKRMLETGY